MGIWELAKKLGKGVVNMLHRPTKHVFAVHPSTSEEVRQGLRSTGAEVVETKPLPREKPTLMQTFGIPYNKIAKRPARYRQGYILGETFDLGINKVKRAIRALPKKEQRAARTAFIKNLRASGVKN
ncbi:hypothetical protein CPT_Ponderosa_012 [Stenotrophomonas phage Ponderosa]|uniref:Uncharacterized protein n=1 Tax=Stenotrophomonas phage Ponderosa TaxID=2591103 RepID=A0A5B9N830_9CAUD|nr:hypothetical protein CPT_Ponderosa_012 [Stenotrophomonas phage Ponderosa]